MLQVALSHVVTILADSLSHTLYKQTGFFLLYYKPSWSWFDVFSITMLKHFSFQSAFGPFWLRNTTESAVHRLRVLFLGKIQHTLHA